MGHEGAAILVGEKVEAIGDRELVGIETNLVKDGFECFQRIGSRQLCLRLPDKATDVRAAAESIELVRAGQIFGERHRAVSYTEVVLVGEVRHIRDLARSGDGRQGRIVIPQVADPITTVVGCRLEALVERIRVGERDTLGFKDFLECQTHQLVVRAMSDAPAGVAINDKGIEPNVHVVCAVDADRLVNDGA